MRQIINDIHINFSKKIIKQKTDYKLFALILIILLLVIFGYIYIQVNHEDPMHISEMVSVIILFLLFTSTPQYINETVINIGKEDSKILKKYLGGFYSKVETVDNESIILAKIVTKQYDNNGKESGSQIRYWIVSSKYDNFNIIRVRKKQDVEKINKALNTLYEKEVTYRTIVIEKIKPNKFINKYKG